LHVRTTSGVPTGAGLASSAAAFASVAVAASRAAGLHLEPPALSALARRGSGSASRSIFGGFVEWRRGARADGRDSIAEPLLPANAWPVRMVVAVTSTARKAVSSREGMARAAASPLYPAWVETAEADLAEARRAIAARDLEALGLVAEHSAMKMHAIGLAARGRSSTGAARRRMRPSRLEPARRRCPRLGDDRRRSAGEGAVASLPTPERISAALRQVAGVERVLTCAPGEGAKVRV
jgi:diphosphomevalonate decarboxylase